MLPVGIRMGQQFIHVILIRSETKTNANVIPMFTSHRRVFAAREPVPESTDHPSGQQIPQQNGPHPLEAPLAGSAKSGIILGTSWLHVELTGSQDIRSEVVWDPLTGWKRGISTVIESSIIHQLHRKIRNHLSLLPRFCGCDGQVGQ